MGDTLCDLLLRRMLFGGSFIDRAAETWSGVRSHDAPLLFNREPFLGHVLLPGHVVVDGLANEIARLGEAKLQ